jgi:hypothetical protein
MSTLAVQHGSFVASALLPKASAQQPACCCHLQLHSRAVHVLKTTLLGSVTLITDSLVHTTFVITSRRCFMQVRDDFGKEVGSKMCYIVGADGGIVPRPVPLPAYGLMTDVAYRWCDTTATAHFNTDCTDLPSCSCNALAAAAATVQ